MPETNLKNGDVSAYGFMCGYVQDAIVGQEVDWTDTFGNVRKGPRFRVRMFAEGCVYHVQISDLLQYYGLRAWESYDRLSDARKSFKKARKFYAKFTGEPLESRRFFTEDEVPEWEDQDAN